MNCTHLDNKKVRGFTLIEVMVAVFIMSVSTALLLANYPDSTIRLNLLNYTHNYALLIREAQVRGSSVDYSASTVGGYGVYINSATSGQAILFSDGALDVNGLVFKRNSAGLPIGDGVYDKVFSPSDYVKDTLKLNDGFSFKKLCVASSTASENTPTPKDFLCTKVNGVLTKSITISFARPSQAAHIYLNNDTSSDYTSACIELYSPKSPTPGHVRSVRVFRAGVVTTSQVACD